MIDKDTLIYDLEQEYAKAYAKYKENDEDPFQGGVCSTLQEVIKLVKEQTEHFEWEDADIVPIGNDYVLLSFANFPVPQIGRYEEDADGGGAYYLGDEEESCCSQDLVVNGWMPLPKSYSESNN